MHHQISNICSAAFYNLRLIARNKAYLPSNVVKTLVQALVFSRIDYCNSLLINLPKYLMNRLQHIQNAAARCIFTLRPIIPTSPFLQKLHWLPVSYRTEFKILIICYKALNDTAPQYLNSIVSSYQPTRALRSANSSLIRPSLHRKQAGLRSFSSASHLLWNNLPHDIRSSTSLSFRHRLKTHLYRKAFAD
jgi:hypothetical protein